MVEVGRDFYCLSWNFVHHLFCVLFKITSKWEMTWIRLLISSYPTLPYPRLEMEQPILDFTFEMPTKFKTRLLMEYNKWSCYFYNCSHLVENELDMTIVVYHKIKTEKNMLFSWNLIFFKLFKYKKIKKNDVICSIYFYRDKLHCFLGTQLNPENQFVCQMSY
jgi:hypothetical protein